MKKLTLVVALIASVAYAVAPTMVLDPPPGTYVGQKADITNPTNVTITVAGNTGVLLNAPVSLAAGESFRVVWNGSSWVAESATAGGFGLSTSFTYQFPTLNSAGGPVCKETTNTITVANAHILDQCSMSTNLGLDGGAALPEYASLSCRAGEGVAVGKLCLSLADGGSLTSFDAGYTVRVSR